MIAAHDKTNSPDKSTLTKSMMRITLLRHGKPAFELKGYVRAKDVGLIVQSYNASGIIDAPPRETIEAVQREHLVVCSELRRSIDSAKALGFEHIHVKETLFCETLMPHFTNGSASLPIVGWLVVLRILWFFGFSRNGESLTAVRKRARLAAERLVQLAEEHQSVLLVGHGLINHFISRELRKSGWLGPFRPGMRYWEYATYEQSAT